MTQVIHSVYTMPIVVWYSVVDMGIMCVRDLLEKGGR